MNDRIGFVLAFYPEENTMILKQGGEEIEFTKKYYFRRDEWLLNWRNTCLFERFRMDLRQVEGLGICAVRAEWAS